MHCRSWISSQVRIAADGCVSFFQAEDVIRDLTVTGVQTCALPILRIGQSAATFGTVFYNTMFPLAANAEFYSFGGFSNRAGDAGAFRRFPDQDQQVTPEIFRYGFLPLINTGITDRSVSAGVRSEEHTSE